MHRVAKTQLEHFPNLVTMFLTRARERNSRPFLWARADGEWQPISYSEAARQVLERIPPEVASDLHDRGMTLTGGIALLAGMDARISEGTRLQVAIAESPRQSVARGLIALYDQPLLLRRVARNVELR